MGFLVASLSTYRTNILVAVVAVVVRGFGGYTLVS